MSEYIISTSDDDFEKEVLESTQPVLVDFWAPWCAPCRGLAPILEALAQEYAGKLKIAKIDVDNNDKIAAKYGIRSIPTLILFKAGQLVETKIGALSKSQLVEFLNAHIA